MSAQSDRKINLKKNEYRIMNIECRRNVFCLFYKKTERSDSILRNSAVRYSIFCGSLSKTDPAIEVKDLIQMHTLIHGL